MIGFWVPLYKLKYNIDYILACEVEAGFRLSSLEETRYQMNLRL